jgi:hypothetical protein
MHDNPAPDGAVRTDGRGLFGVLDFLGFCLGYSGHSFKTQATGQCRCPRDLQETPSGDIHIFFLPPFLSDQNLPLGSCPFYPLSLNLIGRRFTQITAETKKTLCA